MNGIRLADMLRSIESEVEVVCIERRDDETVACFGLSVSGDIEVVG